MMGSNSDGQLGIGDRCPNFPIKDSAGAPCLVEALRDKKIISINCGKNYTFAIVAQ
jgi:alpha-tubulin suppressor-like RCC1 family protein